MIRCEYCQQKNEDTAPFCVTCGAPLPDFQARVQELEKDVARACVSVVDVFRSFGISCQDAAHALGRFVELDTRLLPKQEAYHVR